MIVQAFLLIYLLLSFVVAISDILQIRRQEKYLNEIDLNDLEFHELYRIFGVHNVIFFPGCFLILIYLLIVVIVNRFKSRM
ncbi:MAG: hypothetical protein IKG42_03440 [Clostridia bacterium]|nr:hypothetical protein [Clostridia bacterium]